MSQRESGRRLHQLRMKDLGVGGWFPVAIGTSDEKRELLRRQQTEVCLVHADLCRFKTTLNRGFGCAFRKRFRVPSLASEINGNFLSRRTGPIVNSGLRKKSGEKTV